MELGSLNDIQKHILNVILSAKNKIKDEEPASWVTTSTGVHIPLNEEKEPMNETGKKIFEKNDTASIIGWTNNKDISKTNQKANFALKRIISSGVKGDINHQAEVAANYIYGVGKINKASIDKMSNKKKEEFIGKATRALEKIGKSSNNEKVEKALKTMENFRPNFDVGSRRVEREKKKEEKKYNSKSYQKSLNNRFRENSIKEGIKEYYNSKKSGDFTGDKKIL